MEPVKLLRNLREITKLLILLELATKKITSLKVIAHDLCITIQGVSEYLKLMSKEGLVHRIGNEYKPTKKGIQFLHYNFSQLQKMFEKKVRELSIVDVCTAIARDDLKKNDRVALFMEKGLLVAYKNRKSTSVGIANSDAKKGDLVAVTELSGIVPITQGRLYIIVLPPAWDAKIDDARISKVRKIYSKLKPDIVGTDGLEAYATAIKIGLKINIEFAVVQSAVEACQKGLDVMLLTVSPYSHRLVATLEEININLPEHIKFEIIAV